jgi:hypothetical protein
MRDSRRRGGEVSGFQLVNLVPELDGEHAVKNVERVVLIPVRGTSSRSPAPRRTMRPSVMTPPRS